MCAVHGADRASVWMSSTAGADHSHVPFTVRLTQPWTPSGIHEQVTSHLQLRLRAGSPERCRRGCQGWCRCPDTSVWRWLGASAWLRPLGATCALVIQIFLQRGSKLPPTDREGREKRVHEGWGGRRWIPQRVRRNLAFGQRRNSRENNIGGVLPHCSFVIFLSWKTIYWLIHKVTGYNKNYLRPRQCAHICNTINQDKHLSQLVQVICLCCKVINRYADL